MTTANTKKSAIATNIAATPGGPFYPIFCGQLEICDVTARVTPRDESHPTVTLSIYLAGEPLLWHWLVRPSLSMVVRLNPCSINTAAFQPGDRVEHEKTWPLRSKNV